MAATMPAMAPGLGRITRLVASGLIVTLLTGWAWFGAVDRHRAAGAAAISWNADRPGRPAPTPGLRLVGGAAQVYPSRREGIGRMTPRLDTVEPLGSAVAVSAPIVMSFSEPMARASVEASFAIRPQVDGTLTWADDFTLRFQPYGLAHDVTYEVQVRGRSVRGMPSAGQLRWSFTTVTGPPLVNLPGPSTIKVPILMYHYIRVNQDRRDWMGYALSVTPPDFAAQMDWLTSNGYHPITTEDLYAYLNGTRGLPSRPVILSFDDGYADFFTTALPILRSHDFKAVAYVVSGFVGRPGYMNAAQVLEADRSGIEIGSHTINHADLSRTSAGGVRIQLSGSKQALEHLLGHPVVAFCYPSGKFNSNVVSAVMAAGYHDATTTGFGFPHALSDRYVWGRVRVSGGERLDKFASDLLTAS
jgi:peptidoglycan/xylan/chitin deacetylase (PgdA/CDA1 family)